MGLVRHTSAELWCFLYVAKDPQKQYIDSILLSNSTATLEHSPCTLKKLLSTIWRASWGMKWVLWKFKDIKFKQEISVKESDKKEQEKEIGIGFSSQDYYWVLDPKRSCQVSLRDCLFNIKYLQKCLIFWLHILCVCWIYWY